MSIADKDCVSQGIIAHLATNDIMILYSIGEGRGGEGGGKVTSPPYVTLDTQHSYQGNHSVFTMHTGMITNRAYLNTESA